MTPAEASSLVFAGIPALALLVAALFVAGAAYAATRAGRSAARAAAFSALGVGGYFAVSGALAASGLLADVTLRPPVFPIAMLALTATTVMVARSRFGARLGAELPLWALVGAQGFRLPLELVMREAAHEGVMTVEMSFEGYNFDVVTGITALALGATLLARGGRLPRRLVLAWNLLGTTLLVIVVSIAFASGPLFQAFGPDRVNTWVLYFPYVFLPAILVQAAVFGHVVIFRRLSDEARSTATAGARGFVHRTA